LLPAGHALGQAQGGHHPGSSARATAAAINLDRIAAWFAARPLAPARISRFAALAA